jgi:hypothetical protein
MGEVPCDELQVLVYGRCRDLKITTTLVNCSKRGTSLSHLTYPGSGRRRRTSEIASVSKKKDGATVYVAFS